MLKKLFPGTKPANRYPEQALSFAEQASLSTVFNELYQAEPEPQKLFDLCKQHADLGVIDAIYLLALLYERGDSSVQAYYPQAIECYKRCAEYKDENGQGHAQAQYNLALIYAQDKFGGSNFALAYGYFQAAAEQGVVEAQYNLACMCDDGLGCPIDKAKAFHWYEKAAQQGFARAAHNIGQLYQHGEGVKKDLLQAYAWVLLAAKQGVPEAQEAEPAMTAALDKEQLLMGKKLLDDLINVTLVKPSVA
jgi:hypothetical protein